MQEPRGYAARRIFGPFGLVIGGKAAAGLVSLVYLMISGGTLGVSPIFNSTLPLVVNHFGLIGTGIQVLAISCTLGILIARISIKGQQ